MSLDLSTLPPSLFYGRDVNRLFFLPHPALRGYIAHYTITWSVAQHASLTLMPDLGGCLVFNLTRPEKDTVWGAYSRSVRVGGEGESYTRFFVEFHPGGAWRLLGVPMRELADAQLPLPLVLPALYAQMQQILQKDGNIQRILGEVNALFLGRLALDTKHDSAAPILKLLSAISPNQPVKELAKATGYSERQLGRIFAASLGLTVKTSARVIRINRLLGIMAPGVTIAAAAQQAGYYDQSHLNHEFKQVSGVSPGTYLSSMSDFYKEEFK